jgi:hypothetical protein
MQTYKLCRIRPYLSQLYTRIFVKTKIGKGVLGGTNIRNKPPKILNYYANNSWQKQKLHERGFILK